MIKLLDEVSKDIFDNLKDNHYKRKIKASYLAYGCKYDFCRFYKVEHNDLNGLICLFNSTMTVSLNDKEEFDCEFIEDFIMFINMNKPMQIEVCYPLAFKLKHLLENDYKDTHRTFFQHNLQIAKEEIPLCKAEKLDDVFDILKVSFPDLENSYEMWLTDNSHRVRHGLSVVYLLGNHTTATVQYMLDGVAFIGYVATLPQMRGKGYARTLLDAVCKHYTSMGYKVQLFSRKHRVSYYNELGFEKISEEILLERINTNE